MASETGKERQAIRERKRQALLELRKGIEATERAQDASFSALERLSTQLDRVTELASASNGDPIERATQMQAAITAIGAAVDDVRSQAETLVKVSGTNRQAVAEMLGVKQAALFPRRSASVVRQQRGNRVDGQHNQHETESEA
jgi:hypothetical protein